MKFLLTIIIFATCCSAEKNYGFNPIDSLTGKVASVKEFKYKAKKKKNGAIKPRKNPFFVSTKEYNPDRNLTLESYIITYANSITFKYNYNDKGYLILKIRVETDSLTTFYPEEAYEYDTTGKCTKVIGYNFEGKMNDTTKFEYKLDETGKVIAQYKFNKKNEIEESVFDIVYDHCENRISQTIVDDDNDTEKVSTKFNYNTLGFIVKEMRYDNGNLKNVYCFKYSPDGKITEIIKTDQGTQKIDDRETFTYSSEGKLIEHCDYSNIGSIERKTFNFECDTHGNWIYLVIVDDDNDYYVHKREITYYP
jgi:hypothetical protein